MKTKNKVLALAEIAIVLCSVFLVALPAIAAAASEIYEPGPLDVFGNANEDDTIDMRDTTYIKLVIFGKKPKTDLADANYDGKVSMLDVGQTKLIILGKEKKLTYIDIFGEAETVNKPIRRLVDMRMYSVPLTRALGAKDIIVAVGESFREEIYWRFYPDICKLPSVGGWDISGADLEMILELKPDAVMTGIGRSRSSDLEKKRMAKEKLPGIPLISLQIMKPDALSRSARTYGYILDREEAAEEFIEWYEGYRNLFKSRTEGLSKDERPRVYIETGNKPYHACCPITGSFDQSVVMAGGRNILEDLPEVHDCSWATDVDPEWVIEQNPEIIFVRGSISRDGGSYKSDDPSGMAAKRQTILDRPELANVDAVKNGRVYVVANALCYGGGHSVLGIAYMARLLHPELFPDIDPKAIHQEYIDKFCYVDFDVYEHGVFFYPPPEEW